MIEQGVASPHLCVRSCLKTADWILWSLLSIDEDVENVRVWLRYGLRGQKAGLRLKGLNQADGGRVKGFSSHFLSHITFSCVCVCMSLPSIY